MREDRNLLITGASSGIGAEAARRLQTMGHRLTLLCRSEEAGHRSRKHLGASPRILIADLADLEAVDRISRQLLDEGEAIDTLVLNAGLQLAGTQTPQWSRQGIELTFAVNQLAHQRLLEHLLPLLLSSNAPRVVITASDVHNPLSGGGRVGRSANLGTLEGLRSGSGFAMVDGGTFDADKAYKDSKLCNVLLGRELSRRLAEQASPFPVLSWSPGLVIPRGNEGFFRTSRACNPLGMNLFALLARDVLRLTETPARAGELLADLCVDNRWSDAGFHYLSNHLIRPGQHRFEAMNTSVEACDQAKATALWTHSSELIQAVLPGAQPSGRLEL